MSYIHTREKWDWKNVINNIFVFQVAFDIIQNDHLIHTREKWDWKNVINNIFVFQVAFDNI